MTKINGTYNPIIKTLKENDIIMMEIPPHKQICRLFNLKYIPPDEKFDFDWLDFDAEILYTNLRMHKSVSGPIGNCRSITEIIPTELVQTIARKNDLWKGDAYFLSDAEFEAGKRRLNSLFS